MFEKQVSELLQSVVGEYIEDIDRKSLSFSVLQGDVQLREMKLKKDALENIMMGEDIFPSGGVPALRAWEPEQ